MAQNMDEMHKRPKGILKNPSSHNVPQVSHTSDTIPPPPSSTDPVDTKELTLQNTLQNAGRRRSSSTTRPGTSSRRQSLVSIKNDENSPRLKWDEANLYLTEQEKTAKMKIDEPKTPFAPHYDPAEDEEEMKLVEAQERLIDAQGVVVDELDESRKPPRKAVAEDDIPELELGVPEESIADVGRVERGDRIVRDRSLSNESHRSDKHVVVGADETNGEAASGADGLMTTEEAKEKHRQFEQQRKRHYEMRNIKELLAHPENLDEMDEDEDNNEDEDDRSPPAPPLMPQIPERFLNGKK
ncbi:PP1-complex regulatory subunit GLC8 [Aspergillus tanneri]|uniref:Protein phosphatase inhibitor 2 n=1 Tax=Aspergillus tanneri TaxID=1220188 RepID=A0A5M9MF01_9EURO|nr:uncharacterized protein ATNIH1004_009841 [Aspergillus tanneri]KAA8643079.1 hypothetical protein ATNIH1004_009841 [Aspergillus tanneri]